MRPRFTIVSPDQFEFSVSITILAMVILGGLGNVYGVIVGAILIGIVRPDPGRGVDQAVEQLRRCD